MEIREIMYRTVCEEDFACVMKSGSLPVLATPRMIAWMEEASCLALDLQPGQTSVGIWLNVSHDAPSAKGDRIRIESILEKREGRICTFAVSAWCGSIYIGKGSHKRAIVDAKKFMDRLEKR